MAEAKPSVYALIPAHNRRETTLRCLDHLPQHPWLQVVVIDDGSIDGTAAAVAAAHPQVTVLPGSGQLWWTGAIELGMRHAYGRDAEFFLWLNDDTLPAPGTVEQLVAHCQRHPRTLAASQCSDGATFTYGGQRRRGLRQEPMHAAADQVLSCDALDGNLVCLPRSVVEDVGYPPGRPLPHYGGDNLYTWRARRAGYGLHLLGSAPAQCPRDHPTVSWVMDGRPMGEYWGELRSQKSQHYPPGYWYFCTRYWGVAGIVPFLRPYLRLTAVTLLRWLLPRPWLVWLKQRS